MRTMALGANLTSAGDFVASESLNAAYFAEKSS